MDWRDILKRRVGDKGREIRGERGWWVEKKKLYKMNKKIKSEECTEGHSYSWQRWESRSQKRHQTAKRKSRYRLGRTGQKALERANCDQGFYMSMNSHLTEYIILFWWNCNTTKSDILWFWSTKGSLFEREDTIVIHEYCNVLTMEVHIFLS